ncbi:MAG: phosphoglucosamine mutase [Gammaproteobacteria bacterium]|nr:phosphoglucosamine mutase [Gammaproteobacteria bacterium]
MTKKYFGTDGIRGRVGEFPITPDFFLKLGWATGKVLANGSNSSVLIGKDTRVSGYMFESALEAGLTSAGVDIKLLGPMPTPAVAYLTRTFQAQAGIVISASHNGYQDNGIKFFSTEGRKLGDDVEYAIEAAIDSDSLDVSPDRIGKASRINDASGRYVEFCKGTIHSNIKFNGLKIVLDCANGATYHIAPNVFKELGAEVSVIGNTPDGININQDCGSTKPEKLARQVLDLQADLGIAFDGDGDRVQMVDHTGAIVDGDELLYIIALYKLGKAPRNQGVIGTVMSNLGLELALADLQIPFRRTPVGDRYVMQELHTRQWSIGGESSGHLICLDKTTTGDGIISALQVLAAMQVLDKSLHEIKQGMTKFPQSMINVRLQKSKDLNGNKNIASAVKDAETTLGKEGRVLLRPSGTEPVVRVMVEGSDEVLVAKLAKDISDVVSLELAS